MDKIVKDMIRFLNLICLRRCKLSDAKKIIRRENSQE